jgi:hypothetical protein
MSEIQFKKYSYIKHIYLALKYCQHGGARKTLYEYIISNPMRNLFSTEITTINTDATFNESDIKANKELIVKIVGTELNKKMSLFNPWLYVFLVLCSDSNNYIAVRNMDSTKISMLENQVNNIIQAGTFNPPVNTVSMFLKNIYRTPLYNLNRIPSYTFVNNQTKLNTKQELSSKFQMDILRQLETSFNASNNKNDKVFYNILYVMIPQIQFNIK